MIVTNDDMGKFNTDDNMHDNNQSMSQTAMDKFTALNDTLVNQESSTESAETHSYWPGS